MNRSMRGVVCRVPSRELCKHALILFVIGWSYAAQADSLSDLNMQDFSQRKVQTVNPSKSPFVPQRTAKEELLVQDLRLSGVAYSEGEAYALVSGTVVRVGDHLAGYRVGAIERTRVVLRKLDETVVLQMEGAM